jgi:hypothetical protein
LRQSPEYFGEEELDLIYIGKKLKRSLRLEEVLTEARIDYAVEVDYYTGGVVFRTTRAGAFFYVRPADRPRAVDAMRQAAFDPLFTEEADSPAET